MSDKVKSHKQNVKQKGIPEDNFKDYFSNKWFPFIILLLFWIIFFRELISGSAFLFDDFIQQYYPGKTMLAVSLKNGILPFWNPYTFSGMPFFADIQIGILYPFNAVQALFVHSEKLSPVIIQFTIVLHYLLCSVFTYYVGKHFKFSNAVSVLFAIMFTYSSYTIIHMIHMPLIEAMAWFPLMFLLWLKFIEQRKYIYIFGSVIVMVLCILSGYPQVAFFNYFFIAFFILSEFIHAVREKDFKTVRDLIFGFLIFLILPFGITALQLLPTNEFVSLSNRASFDYDFAKQGSMHPYDFLTFFMPKIFGVWTGNRASTDLPYWAKHNEGMWMFSVTNVFISAFVVFLIIPSVRYFLKKRDGIRLTGFLMGMAVFTVLFSLGGFFFFHRLLYDFVPLFNRFRNPAHILYLFTFSISLLSAFAFDRFIKEKKDFSEFISKKYLYIVLGIFAAIFLLVLAGFFKSGDLLSNEQVYIWVKKQYSVFFVFLLLFSGLCFLYLNNKIGKNIFVQAIVLILCLEIYTVWYDQNNGTESPEKSYIAAAGITNQLREELKTEQFRINMRDYSKEHPGSLFERNQGMIDRIPLIEGYGALLLKRYYPFTKPDTTSTQSLDLMNVKYKISPDVSKRGRTLMMNNSYLPKARMFYDYKVIENENEIKRYMESNEYDYRKTLVLEKNPAGINLQPIIDSLSLKGEVVKISNFGLNEISLDVTAPQNGFLFLSEIYYPAWKAYIDGKESEILRADYCFRAVYLEKGNHKIEFKYDSETFKTGLNISLVSLLIFISGTVFAFIRRRKKEGVKETESVS